MALSKRPVTVRPAGTDQRVEASQLPPGRLTRALNVHQPTPGELVKRDGHTPMTAATSTGGNLANGRAMASTGSSLVQATNEGVYGYSSALTAWVRKASTRGVWAPVPKDVSRQGFRPSSVKVGSLIYYFSADHGCDGMVPIFGYAPGDGVVIRASESRASWWSYRVVDADTGVEVVGNTLIDTVRGYQAKPVVIGTTVWLFVGAELTGVISPTESRYIRVAKFASTTPTVAPVVTTYYDAGANAVLRGWDVYAAAGVAYFVAFGQNGAAAPLAVCSKLDTATGVVAASPGTVALAGALSSAYPLCVSWYENVTAGATFYVGVTGQGFAPNVYAVDSTTLAQSGATITLAGIGITTTLLAGYRDSTTGNFVNYMSWPYEDGTSFHTALERWEHTSAGASVSYQFRPGLSVATKPFEHGSRWYVIGHHDDGEHGQNGYVLVDGSASLDILGRSLYGEAGDLTQLARGAVAWPAPPNDIGSHAIGHWVGRTPRVEGDTITATLNAWDRSQYVSRDVIFAFDTRMRALSAGQGDGVVFPGSWPLHATGGAVTEHPTQYPPSAPTIVADTAGAGGLSVGGYAVCYVYSYRAENGDVYESRPSPLGTVYAPSGSRNLSVTFEYFTMTNSAQPYSGATGGAQGSWSVDFYVTSPVVAQAPGGATEIAAAEAAAALLTPYLQVSIPNVTNAAAAGSVTLVLNTLRTDRALYSADGAELANDPPPPFRVAATWQNRLFVAYGGEVWPTKEKRFGQGWSWSAVHAFIVASGDDEITAMGAVSDTHFAIFKSDGIWIITGRGPDSARGHGQYQPQRLDYATGCTNHASTVTTPKGLMYQDAQDGGIYLLTLGLERVYVGAGAENYRGDEITGSTYDAVNGRAIFLLEST